MSLIKYILRKYKGFNKDGFNKKTFTAFDVNGFDINGFDINGFDKNGFDKNGFDKNGFDKRGFNKYGKDNEGYDKNGFNIHGFNRNGKHSNGTLFDYIGYDVNGFDINGFNKYGFDKNGFNKLGYNKLGYNKLGYNKLGYNKRGFDINGLHENGTKYDKYGFDRYGFNKSGFNIDGFNKNGYNKLGYNKRGFDINGLHENGTKYDSNGLDVNGKPKNITLPINNINKLNINSTTKNLTFIDFVKTYSTKQLSELIYKNYNFNVELFHTRPELGFNGVYEYVAALLLSIFDKSTQDDFSNIIQARFKKEITSPCVLSDYFDKVVNKSKVPYQTWSEVWRYLKSSHKWIESTPISTGRRYPTDSKISFIDMYKKYNPFYESYMQLTNLTDETIESDTIWLAEIYLEDFINKKEIEISNLMLLLMHLKRNNLNHIEKSKSICLHTIIEYTNFNHPDFDEDLLYRLEKK